MIGNLLFDIARVSERFGTARKTVNHECRARRGGPRLEARFTVSRSLRARFNRATRRRWREFGIPA